MARPGSASASRRPQIVALLASPTPIPWTGPAAGAGRRDQTPVRDDVRCSGATARSGCSVVSRSRRSALKGTATTTRQPSHLSIATCPSRYGPAGGRPDRGLAVLLDEHPHALGAGREVALEPGGSERRSRGAGGDLHIAAAGDRGRGGFGLSHLRRIRLTARRHGGHETAVDVGDLVVLEQAQHEEAGGHQRYQRQPDQHDGKLVTKPHLWRSPGRPIRGRDRFYPAMWHAASPGRGMPVRRSSTARAGVPAAGARLSRRRARGPPGGCRPRSAGTRARARA